MTLDPSMWSIVREGGFTAIACVLIWYVLRTTGEREKSFREREASFIKLSECYADKLVDITRQLQDVARILEKVQQQGQETERQMAAVKQTLDAWMDRRMKETK